jgi:hypothetical protein
VTRYRSGERSANALARERQMCYVAVKPCGCVIGAVVPLREDLSHLSRHVAGWMRKGYAIEQHTLGDAREMLGPCAHSRPAIQERLPL